jgi:hypothetical protein
MNTPAVQYRVSRNDDQNCPPSMTCRKLDRPTNVLLP